MSEKLRFIHRAVKDSEHPYFLFSRATAQDRTLSFEARGMLAYILSKPDDWRVQPKDLEQGISKNTVYKILAELIRRGYVERTQTRNEKKQIISWDYAIHENPLPKKQEIAFPEIGKLEIAFCDSTEKRIDKREKKQKKETSLPSGKVDPEFEIIASVWETRAGGYVSNIQGMLFASKKVKGKWKECEFNPVATVDEVREFGAYATKRAKDGKVPTQPDTIQRWFYDYRAEKVKRAAATPKVTMLDLSKWEVPELEDAV